MSPTSLTVAADRVRFLLCPPVQAQDVVYLGGDSVDAVVKGGQDLGMPFVFGCQSYETGLFRTQLENGIMGLSNQDLTLVPKLKVRACSRQAGLGWVWWRSEGWREMARVASSIEI